MRYLIVKSIDLNIWWFVRGGCRDCISAGRVCFCSAVYSGRLCCCLKPRSSGWWDSSHEESKISSFQFEDSPRLTLLLITQRKRPSAIWRYAFEVALGIFNSKLFCFFIFYVCCLLLRRTECPRSNAGASDWTQLLNNESGPNRVIDLIISESIIINGLFIILDI